MLGFCRISKETAQETLDRLCYWRKTLAGLSVLLGSCFRRNDECWIFAESRKRLCKKPSLGCVTGGFECFTGFLLSQERRMLVFCRVSKETVQETLARLCYWRKTLAGLAILLGSCFRRNDECWVFAESRKRLCKKPSLGCVTGGFECFTGFLLSQERRMLGFCRVSKETVQETLDRLCYMWKTLAGLSVLLGSCFRRNDECWVFAESRKRPCKKPSIGCVTCGKPWRV